MMDADIKRDEEIETLKQRIRDLEKELEDKSNNDDKKKTKNIGSRVMNLLGQVIATGNQNLMDSMMSNDKLNWLSSLSTKKTELVLNEKEEIEDEEEIVDDDQKGKLKIKVDNVEAIPKSNKMFERYNIKRSDYVVNMVVKDSNGNVKKSFDTKEFEADEFGDSLNLEEEFDLSTIHLNDQLEINLRTTYRLFTKQEGISVLIGSTTCRFGDLLRDSFAIDDKLAKGTIWLEDPESFHIIFDHSLERPTSVNLSFDVSKLPKQFPVPTTKSQLDQQQEEQENPYEKHVMIVSRGTRGDVQPFIAIARGLANEMNWRVTICTENRYRPLVERYSETSAGKVEFSSSGGDLERELQSELAKMGLKNKLTVLQFMIYASAERHYFDSEPAFFYHAKRLKPDYLMFGFTTANIAMVLSEALEIPMIGFILQPTVIPSNQYPVALRIKPGILSTTEVDIKVEDEEEEGEEELEIIAVKMAHKVFSRLKFAVEHMPGYKQHPLNVSVATMLNEMRKNRGLEPFSHRTDNFKLMFEQNIPMVVPMNSFCFGGTPKDWAPNCVLTDFIFLRSGSTPNLTAKYVKFITEAKITQGKLVVITFSSMPVEFNRILELCVLMLEKCDYPIRLLALVGHNRTTLELQYKDEQTNNTSSKSKVGTLFGKRKSATANIVDEDHVETRAFRFVQSGKLLIDKGAPFQKLFPLMDLIIEHGGVGTTGEALRSGCPIIVTGVMQTDQRFWGHRISSLGIGPPPAHVFDVHETLVDSLNKALAPDSEWKAQALIVRDHLLADQKESSGMCDSGDDEDIDKIDGVHANVRAVVELLNDTKAVKRHHESINELNNSDFAKVVFSDVTKTLKEDAKQVRGIIKSTVNRYMKK